MKYFEKRFEVIDKIIEILGEHSACYGEFLRNFYEFKFKRKFDDLHVLKFYYINKKQGFFDEKLVSKFNDFITDFKIGSCLRNYKIVNVMCTKDSRHFGFEEKIPYYRLTLNCLDDFICVDILCWKPKFLGEISINCLEYNMRKFYSGDSRFTYDFIIDQIKNGEMTYNKDLSVLQNLAFPTKAIPRTRKVKFLSLIYNNIERKMNHLPLEYKMKGVIPFIKKELFEDCPITSSAPPYLNINLECGHTVSLDAYKGIIFSKNENSEAIRCPYCRGDLKMKFVNL
jgi:hypothetical protein